jgi:hypothetical protein
MPMTTCGMALDIVSLLDSTFAYFQTICELLGLKFSLMLVYDCVCVL